MSEFLNANSGWISILLFVLSFPLGILGTLVAPKVDRWLALRSHKANKRRIGNLEKTIEDTDRLVSEPVYAVSKFAVLAALALAILIIDVEFYIIIVGLFVISYSPPPLPPPDLISTGLLLGGILAGLVAGAIFTYIVALPFRTLINMANRVRDYKRWREQTLNEIEELKHHL